MSSQYCNVTSYQYFTRDEHSWWARTWKNYEGEKTSESIRKKHRALKIDRIEKDMALNRYFKPIIKLLRQIVDSPVRAINSPVRQSRDDDERLSPSVREKKRRRRERKRARHSATMRKSDDRSHDRVQPITSTPRTTIVPTIESLEEFFRNDGRFASNEDSKSIVNVGRSRGVASRLGPWVKSTLKLSWGEREINRRAM